MLQRTQPEKELQITWDSFRDRLKAGDKETWSFTLRDDKGRPAEGVAVAVWMYDAALEAFGKLAPWDPALRLKETALSHLLGSYFISVDKQSGGRYPDGAWWTAWLGDKPRGAFRSPFIKKSATTEEDDDEEEDNVEPMLEIGSPMLYGARSTMQLSEYKIVSAPSDMGSSRARAKKAEESAPAVKLRKDFSETTFFLPELKTDSKGQVSWSFNAPEQLSSLAPRPQRPQPYAGSSYRAPHGRDISRSVSAPRSLASSVRVMPRPSSPRCAMRAPRHSMVR